MKVIFWLALLLTSYTYIGYALLLWIEAKLRPKPVCSDAITPAVSIIMAARNEEKNLPRKLQNLYELDYPSEHIQIVVASDGSTDATPRLLLEQESRVFPVILECSTGKAAALNEAVKHATGHILVFLDVRQEVERDAISKLVGCFADSTVGAVSGELLLWQSKEGSSSEALGIYWKIEKFVRKMESLSGSVVGVTGAIYAIRRELYPHIPRGTILDDVFVPMHIAARGKRVVFQPAAVARDRIFGERGKEFSRKVRTLTGNYQLLRLAPWLLTAKNPLRFRFVSHKLLRLVVPLLLVAMLISCALASGALYKALLSLQVLFYLFAAVGVLAPTAQRLKPVSVASTFVMLNVAAGVAFYNFLFDREAVWA